MDKIKLIVDEFENRGLNSSESFILAAIRKQMPVEVGELDCPLDRRELCLHDVLNCVWDDEVETLDYFVSYILN
jgi:hypothetical protein